MSWWQPQLEHYREEYHRWWKRKLWVVVIGMILALLLPMMFLPYDQWGAGIIAVAIGVGIAAGYCTLKQFLIFRRDLLDRQQEGESEA